MHAPAAQPTTTPALRVVTAEDAKKAQKAIEDLERIERLVTTVLVVLGVGGLVFTAVNVTLFARDHHVHWAIAWMLDPLVSVSLLAALFIDGKLSAHGYRPGGWPFVLRWFAGLSTWLMNCWGSLYPDADFTGWPDRPDPAGLLLHSVIPVLVIVLAEAGAGYRKFSTRKKAEHLLTLSDWKTQQDAERKAARATAEAEESRRRDQKEREADEARKAARAAAEAEEARKAEAAAAEAAAIKAAAEADAEERKIRAAAQAEEQRLAAVARVEEQRRLAAREEEERRRIAAERQAEAERLAEENRARIDRENAAHAAALEAQLIAAKSKAEAEQKEIDDRLAAEREAREAKARAAEERRARAAETAAETTAETDQAATAKPRKLTALPNQTAAAVAEVRGAEAKRKQIEEANFEAAVLIFLDDAPTRKDFAARYGRGETWGRDRYADAERLMAQDEDFADRVMAEAEQRTAPKAVHSA